MAEIASSPETPEPKMRAVPASERLLLDLQSAAEMLSLSPVTLQKLPIPQVKLPAIRRVFYRRADLELYVRSLVG